MDDRFEPLSASDTVLRLARRGSGYLPAGRVYPLPNWLAPTREDRDEAESRGRRPGLSVWDHARTTPDQARDMTDRPDEPAWCARVGPLLDKGRDHGVLIDVVRDPAEHLRPQPGWDGHSLIEGIARPPGAPKARYKALRASLIPLFSRC